jgi:hypothetical protein
MLLLSRLGKLIIYPSIEFTVSCSTGGLALEKHGKSANLFFTLKLYRNAKKIPFKILYVQKFS